MKLPEGLWQVCLWEEGEFYSSISGETFQCASIEWVACPDCFDEDYWPEPESWITYEEADIGFSCEHCGLCAVDENDFEDEEC